MATTPELDSAAKIRVLRADFEDDGQMISSNIQFMFDYISALEIALEYSAGAGLTQAESDAADETDTSYSLSGYVEEAMLEKDSHQGRHRAEGV